MDGGCMIGSPGGRRRERAAGAAASRVASAARTADGIIDFLIRARDPARPSSLELSPACRGRLNPSKSYSRTVRVKFRNAD